MEVGMLEKVQGRGTRSAECVRIISMRKVKHSPNQASRTERHATQLTRELPSTRQY